MPSYGIFQGLDFLVEFLHLLSGASCLSQSSDSDATELAPSSPSLASSSQRIPPLALPALPPARPPFPRALEPEVAGSRSQGY
ncbi:hypothetical protein LIER_16241 [Lithospermum erythrorhizon]|uniref:Uncharacterized protein n=1 Tax=Lithospermum erythrorhizon TaxID=34254 RepID=A0AAV3Q7S7_LITER